MLLDYDFLLLLNDESGNPTRYYYLLNLTNLVFPFLVYGNKGF